MIVYCLLEGDDGDNLPIVFHYFEANQFNTFINKWWLVKLITFNREPWADYFREVLDPTHISLFEPIRQRRREEVAKEEAAIVAVDAAIRARGGVNNDGNSSRSTD